ncbi:diacylglycerol/lipid kinase family protein [Rhodococcus sp. P1Y]|uniref:diacylglycerol/lipid kinase family protein n=1 Tax=Rhodococcus sp. P1Y TaxID=1302308 RepID=UPI000EAB5319|nr:diacylglycerol kinase family protein [Rhodococcus sp. P1Y]AYJ49277.1 diacylglycerol kinase family lipid kinase [Rhodococcus sp. P1Y]
MRALLIVNPNATSTTPAARDLLAHALSSRVRVTVAHTTHRDHAAELARQAREDGIGLVIVHGGDGTVNEVINGLLGVPLPTSMSAVTIGAIPALAVVPGGSANVFARSLGIHADPVAATNQLIDLLAARSRRTIGLGHCDNRWFTFNAGLGLDAEVCQAIDASRKDGRPVSPTRYVRAAIHAFFRNKRRDPALTVHVDDHDSITGVHYAFVSNSSPWTYLDERPVHTNPGTSFDTGLGLFAMRTTRVLTTLNVSRQLLSPASEPKSRKLFRVDDVPHVRITSSEPIGLQMDGDYLGTRTEADFYSTPAALEVIAPNEA